MVLLPLLANASNASSTAASVCTEGVVMGGFDVVQMLMDGSVPGKKGSEAFKGNYGGYTFWFKSAENLETFKAEPVKYLPAFGGF